MTYHYIAFTCLAVVTLFFVWREWRQLAIEEAESERDLKEFYQKKYYSTFDVKKEDK